MTNDIAGLIAVDNGGHSTCIATKGVREKFLSVKGYCGEMPITNKHLKHSFIVNYLGQMYSMANHAKYDCALPLKVFTDSKQHDFFTLSVLVAIHQYGYSSNYCVISVPINIMNEDERNGLESILKRSHTITVNGEQKTFAITDLKIVPESASAFWCNQPKGKSNFIDIGSRTIGYSSVINNQDGVRFLNTESGVFKKGIELLGDNYNSKALAEFLHGNLSRIWNKNDKVYLLGGGALDANLVTCIKEHFPNSEVMEEADMANVNGMYSIGRILYGMD